MSFPQNCQDTRSATSLQESESGPMHSEKQGSMTTKQSGQGHVRANLSARQAKAKGMLTSGTYGRRFSISSNSVALQLSLANKLKEQLSTAGSILYNLTWKVLDTPSGLRGCLPAACVGAPHIRGRLFWVGNSNHKGLEGHPRHGNETGQQDRAGPTAETSGSVHRLGDSDSNGRGSRGITSAPSRYGNPVDTTSGGMFNPDRGNGFWRDAEWAYCGDGKFRPIEPGTLPLAPRSPTHMGRCRAYGNSIVSQVATEFIKACSLV